MSQPDGLKMVARELAALAGGDRRAILGALDSDDRARLLAILRQPEAVDKRPASPGDSAHSAWFDRLLASAADGSNGAMTAAARAALIDAAATRPRAARAPGRSLLEAAGGLLGGARSR